MKEHDAPDSKNAQKGVVFLPIAQDGTLLCDSEVLWERCRRLAAIMDRLRARIEHYLPSCATCPAAPVNVVAIHKETFIEQTDLVKCLAADHGKTTNDDINGERPVVGKIEHVLPGKKATTFKETLQAARRAKVIPQCRKPPTGTLLRHVWIEDARANIANLWILIEKVGKCIKAFREHNDIGVDESDIPTLALPDRNVVPLREAEILLALDQLHPGKLALYHLDRVIRRSVVDDQNFHVPPRRRLLQAVEAQLKVALRVPGDDDDRYFYGTVGSVHASFLPQAALGACQC